MRVPASGPKDARIMLVGEAPASIEEREGIPFAGPAGEQLNRMLPAAGLKRENLYITNVLKERIPHFKDEKAKQAFFFPGGNPSQRYMEGIVELIQEIKEVRPNVVVPMGNYALWALTQELHISKWRGSILESSLIPGQKVVPTYHPAFYIHGFYAMSFKEPLGIWDFVRIKQEAESPDIVLPKADFIINPTEDQINEAVERLLAGDHITADTEWFAPEDLAYIGFTNSKDWAICIPATSMPAYRAYKKLLSSDIPKTWQNAMFDAVALDRIGIPVKNVEHDSMIAWHSCWADIREKGLNTIGSILTRWPYYKDDLVFVNKRDPEGQVYCCKDCVVTEESMEAILNEEFDYTQGRRGYEISMSIFDIFCKASTDGLRADRPRLIELKHEFLDKAAFIEDTLSDTIGYTINCRSPPQVAQLIYDELGINRKTRTTKQEILMDIAASTKDPAIKAVTTAVVRVRQNRNMVSRYIHEDVIDRDGRIRTNWNLAGTRAARLSTTDPWWNGLALQTAPTEFREVVIPDDGYVFLGWDYAQAEARVVAVLTKDYDLLDRMEDGTDIHCLLASQLPFGMSYDALIQRCKEVEDKDEIHERYLSKKCRHALNYVMGPDTFRLTVNKEYLDTGVGLDHSTSRNLHAAYMDLHPGLKWWWKEIENDIRKTKVLENPFGRVRRFTGMIKNSLTEAVAYRPQSTVADLNTISIAEASERFKQVDPTSQFFLHMHDGGLAQIREEYKEEGIQILRECMTKEIIIDRHPLTIPVDVKMGYNWKDLKYV